MSKSRKPISVIALDCLTQVQPEAEQWLLTTPSSPWQLVEKQHLNEINAVCPSDPC